MLATFQMRLTSDTRCSHNIIVNACGLCAHPPANVREEPAIPKMGTWPRYPWPRHSVQYNDSCSTLANCGRRRWIRYSCIYVWIIIIQCSQYYSKITSNQQQNLEKKIIDDESIIICRLLEIEFRMRHVLATLAWIRYWIEISGFEVLICVKWHMENGTNRLIAPDLWLFNAQHNRTISHAFSAFISALPANILFVFINLKW